MDGQSETERNMLKRVIALLFSLADLAERAAGRAYPVRCYVLWLLRRAEPFAWRCVMRQCGIEPGDPRLPRGLRMPWLLVICNNPADALRVAATYRALARALQKQLRRDQRFARQCSRAEDDWIDLDGGKLAWLEPHLAQRPAYGEQPALPDLGFKIAPRLDTS